MVKALLREGRTVVVKGFKSKAGRPFEAGLALQGCRYVLPFEEGGRRLTAAEAARRVAGSR